MISPSDAYKFIDVNSAILATSGINIDVDSLKASVEKRTFTKKKFLSYVNNEISRFIYKWYNDYRIRNFIDVGLLIIDVRKFGKDFKYTFLKDTELFKSRCVKSLEQGLGDSLIVSFSDGELVRMTFPLKTGWFDKRNVILTRIDNLPQEYDAVELKNTVLQILNPILEFKHEDEETTVFMKNEFLKLIPFENHSWITRKDELQVINWEYCITHGPWKLSRDRVKVILNMFIYALEEYADDSSAPIGWNDIVNNAIQSIKSLMGVAAFPSHFR